MQSAELVEKLSKALTELEGVNILSQSLGGFHEALLMQSQSRQLDIADPLGFPAYQDFAEKEVAPAVENHNRTSPQPFTDFSPLRAGLLRLKQLRLVDSFGQIMDIISPDVVSSETLALSPLEPKILLKPRIPQPARLNFRFLSAQAEMQDSDDHTHTGPICGWILPNLLDQSLMFYDHDGKAIGSLSKSLTQPWKPAPQSSGVPFINEIKNGYLRKVASYLYRTQLNSLKGKASAEDSFLAHFLQVLDHTQTQIEPENFAEHQELAILMGKPMAVVRAWLDLELKGIPAVHQGWNPFRKAMQGHPRTDNGFTRVKIPIRLGEYHQLNDGLLGYWIENDQHLSGPFYSPVPTDNPDSNIRTLNSSEDDINIWRTLEDKPVCLTMLMDPRGLIHATSGVLPAKAIQLPKSQYQQALQNIGITFLTAPILTPENHVQLSLPEEPGYQWAWLEKNEQAKWKIIPQTIIIEREHLEQKITNEPTIWNRLVRLKWLKPLPTDAHKATLTSSVHKAFPPSTSDASSLSPELLQQLNNYFDTYGQRIERFQLHAAFDGELIIREGWLQLMPNPASEKPESSAQNTEPSISIS